MILTTKCTLSFAKLIFFTLVWLKKRINTVRKIHFVLLVLQMSNLFSNKLGYVAFSFFRLATVIYIIFEQTIQISQLQETLHTLCTQAVLDNIQDTDSMSENISSE